MGINHHKQQTKNPMDVLLESKQMEGQTAEEQSKRAIVHVLNLIRSDSRFSDVAGFGTQSFALLTEAAATLSGEPVQKVREYYANFDE